MNAIISLAPSSFGPVLMEKLVSSGEILRLGEKMIRPFYYEKSKKALNWVQKELDRTSLSVS